MCSQGMESNVYLQKLTFCYWKSESTQCVDRKSVFSKVVVKLFSSNAKEYELCWMLNIHYNMVLRYF